MRITTHAFARAGLFAAIAAAAVAVATPSVAQDRRGWNDRGYNANEAYGAYARSPERQNGMRDFGNSTNAWGSYNAYGSCYTDDGYGRYRSCGAADSN